MALGVLRDALKLDKDKYGVDAAVTLAYRIDNRIRLEEDLVAYDVDQFEAAARRIIGYRISEPDIVALGRVVEDLYVDDLYVLPNQDSEVIAARKNELRLLYVDAMEVASRAARETRQLTCACRFARNAFVKSDMREDLLDNLVSLLVEANRRSEAEGFYDVFFAHALRENRKDLSDLFEMGARLFGEDERRVAVRGYSEAALRGIELMDEQTWKKRRQSLA
jgi:two-component SAPR family response regulator